MGEKNERTSGAAGAVDAIDDCGNPVRMIASRTARGYVSLAWERRNDTDLWTRLSPDAARQLARHMLRQADLAVPSDALAGYDAATADSFLDKVDVILSPRDKSAPEAVARLSVADAEKLSEELRRCLSLARRSASRSTPPQSDPPSPKLPWNPQEFDVPALLRMLCGLVAACASCSGEGSDVDGDLCVECGGSGLPRGKARAALDVVSDLLERIIICPPT